MAATRNMEEEEDDDVEDEDDEEEAAESAEKRPLVAPSVSVTATRSK